MKNFSLYNKIFLIFIISTIISLGLVGWFGMKSTSEAYLNSAYELSERSTNMLKIEIEDKLQNVPRDIAYISNFYALKRFIIWKTMGENKKAKLWKQIFSDALIDSLSTQQRYYKSRVIDLSGNEVINAQYNKNTDNAFLYPDKELQNKRGRDYVEKAKSLKKGEFFISQMSLNVEHGKIEKPFIPVLRYSTPIINENEELVAIFVSNVYADELLNIIHDQVLKDEANGFSYYLLDKKGNYLFNENQSKMWNAQLKNGFNFNKEYFNIKERFKDANSGTFEKDSKIYSFSKVYPFKGNPESYWYIVSSVDESVALSKLDEFKMIFSIILLLVLMVSFFGIRAFIIKITEPLGRVTEQLKALSEGEIKKTNINYNANDEVGELVKSTAKLVDAIEMTIQQANAVADGNFTRDIKPLGKNDELGLAIGSMTARLKEITHLAQSLSVGDYDVQVLAKNSDDKLGLALVDMVEYLENITSITESIAVGELDVKYRVKGADDRLGHAILQMIKYLRTILKQANAISKEDFSGNIEAKSKNDELGLALETMTDMLRTSSIQNKNEIYFSDGVGEFSDTLTGISDTVELAKKAITLACRYVNASSGVVYTYDKDLQELSLIASYSYVSRDNLSNKFKLGDGVVGQVALEREAILLKNVKDEEYIVQSGTTSSVSKEVFAFPLIHEGELFGVVELLSFESFSKIQEDYLAKIASVFATALHTTSQNAQIKTLLEKSQEAFEELQTQSEELQESNVQMEEQQQQLTLQSHELQVKNETLAQAKLEIDKRADDLEKASKYKSEFLANMSHELRTPLNSIILLSKLLTQNQNKTLDDKDIEKSSVIHKAGNDLLFLINDILDLSKVESGNMELFYEDISSSEIMNDMEGLFSAVGEEKGVRFIIDDEFNASFSTDKTKLSQVLKNLLSNAFKFTKEGSVTLLVKETDGEINLIVKDSGIGIPVSKLETIFEAFKQVDGSISREFGGTGLGLSISKTIVELMDGEISVESKFGIGTSFIVRLPLVHASKVTDKHIKKVDKQLKLIETEPTTILQGESLEATYENELSNKNILIVDDDSRNIFTLTSTLESMDAEVFSAFNGKEALEVLDTEDRIDLILMDIMMPVMDGLAAIKNIKADSRFKDIPIIAITAKTMPEDKKNCLDAGANDYLPKPLEQSALVSMMKAWIQ